MLNKQLGSISVHCLSSDSSPVKQWRWIEWFHISNSWRREINSFDAFPYYGHGHVHLEPYLPVSPAGGCDVGIGAMHWFYLQYIFWTLWPELHVQVAMKSRPTSSIPTASWCLSNISSRRWDWSFAAKKDALAIMWGWVLKVSLILGSSRTWSLLKSSFVMYTYLAMTKGSWIPMSVSKLSSSNKDMS